MIPELGVYALEVVDPTAAGAPLCRASAREDRFDGVQIALKGGQLGQRDYFGRVRAPGARAEGKTDECRATQE